MTLDARLRRAADALIEGVRPPVRVEALEDRARRKRARRAAGAVVTVVALLLAAAAAVVVARDDDSIDVATSSPTVLPVPPPGEVSPEFLADGTPVFVVHHERGGVDVLLAASTHAPHGLRQLLGWCPAYGGFDDGMYSSTWDEYGRKLAGPAPRNLWLFEIRTEGRRPAEVEVGPLRHGTVDPAPPAVRRGRGGPCSAGPAGRFHGEGMVLHELGRGYALDEVLDDGPEGMVLIENASVVGAPGGKAAWACEGDARNDPAGCRQVAVWGLDFSVSEAVTVVRGAFLARLGEAGLHDLIFTKGWRIDPSRAASTDDPTRHPAASVGSSNLGDLRVSTSSLRPSASAWMTHEVTLENVGDKAIYINDHRKGEFLGDREVLAADDGCGYGRVPGEPVEVACHDDYRPLTLAPGAAVTLRITLWRDLTGMNDLTSERLVLHKPILHRSTRAFTDPRDRDGTQGELVITYERLAQ